ncbi:MAG: hypothetical protein BGO12_06530 [Verrucomicrobia bacterium 61-8]|nr:MAG: hypothetical protein BGO12_06530 [Verrucomicrobia bacterium 61-8]
MSGFVSRSRPAAHFLSRNLAAERVGAFQKPVFLLIFILMGYKTKQIHFNGEIVNGKGGVR